MPRLNFLVRPLYVWGHFSMIFGTIALSRVRQARNDPCHSISKQGEITMKTNENYAKNDPYRYMQLHGAYRRKTIQYFKHGYGRNWYSVDEKPSFALITPANPKPKPKPFLIKRAARPLSVRDPLTARRCVMLRDHRLKPTAHRRGVLCRD